MNLFKFNKLIITTIAVSALVLALVPSVRADELFHTYSLENGIVAHIYTNETILEYMTKRDDTGHLILDVSDCLSYILVEDISDPVISYKGDGSFHLMKPELVITALGEIDIDEQWIGLDVEIYFLPYPRYGCLRSSSRGNMVFLSPGVNEVSEYAQAYIATHEIGHVYQNKYLPDEETDRWTTYLSLRGIYGDPDYSSTGAHMNRPKEIFAEDFRFLFGGELSRYSNTIENPNLPLPDAVEGLETFLVSLVPFDIASGSYRQPDPDRIILAASNYPNPFNPETTIHVDLSGNGRVEERFVDCTIYGIDGAVVRRLFEDYVTGVDVAIHWDGRNDSGAPVASGFYLYRICCENDIVTGKMLLVR